MLTGVIHAVIRAAIVLVDDPVPEDNDVVAGPWGAVIFVALLASATFLAFSFVKQLRKAQAAKDAGVYGDAPADRDADDDGGSDGDGGSGDKGTP